VADNRCVIGASLVESNTRSFTRAG